MDKRRLIFSIVEFLNSEAGDDSNAFSSEAKESLEVANQCLQSAYALSQEDEHLRTEPGLLSLFVSATSHQPMQRKPSPSPEDKEQAERLKVEGNEALRNENAKDAIEKYSKAIEIDGSNQVFYCNRAAAYSKMDSPIQSSWISSVVTCQMEWIPLARKARLLEANKTSLSHSLQS
uniref:Small glutamine-rich tetratricopeptide repeat-containing protein A n=1 Tax=Caligus clemensi TaxID=344056 RepID=C1C220_CALCM|nr:Small glutamine-rich tetratricopeptide repeat-containing protein A [Caligus clemensi]